MTKKRVMAYYMHEHEMAAAQQLIKDAIATDAYMLGTLDDAEIAELRQKGLIVQELDEVGRRPAPTRFEAIHGLTSGVAAAMAEEVAASAAPAPDLSKPQFFLMWLQGPLLAPWRTRLDELKVRVLEALPTGAYSVRLEPDQVERVRKLEFVKELRLYEALDTQPSLIRQIRRARAARAAGAPATGVRAMQTFDIRLHRAEDVQQILDWLKARAIPVAGTSGRKIRVYLLEDSPAISEIPALPEVALFEEYVAPKLFNDRARKLLGVNGPNPGAALAQTGAGQIVAVADTGLDDTHQDFQNRIHGIVALGRPGDASDPHGHGTHVAGSVLGDGSASGGTVRGAAPGAGLFFQSLLDAQGGLGGLPLDLGQLFQEAYDNGARIHNNSWGAATASRYTVNSSEVDEFIAAHRDMLIVISAGNEGTAAAPRTNSDIGFVDWLSIGSPASCKNALTVGASRNDRTQGGLSALSYGAAWPTAFPDPPIFDELVSGNPQSLGAFSSRGPCDDRRIKPDVVAPGTDIASTKSQHAPLSHFWGPYPGNPNYAYMGGTSMSAPLVSGCAALVREYFETTRQHNPSAALLKAALINGTVWLSGTDAIAPAPGMPNFHQGFGCVSMLHTIPNPVHPQFRIEFIDNWQQPAGQFTASGQRLRYRLSLAAPAPLLRICLAYTDAPGRGLQNNLNLFLETSNGQKLMGNPCLPNSLHIPDPDNNVEIIRVDNAPAGNYLLQISAINILKPPQDFALVVGGDNISQLIPI